MSGAQQRLGFPVKASVRRDPKATIPGAGRTGRTSRPPSGTSTPSSTTSHAHAITAIGMPSTLRPMRPPDMPQFHSMVRDSAASRAGRDRRKARRLDIRLSFHPSQYVLLNSPDPATRRKSVWDLSSQAEMLDRMELGPEAVMVIHVGGAYGDASRAARAGWRPGSACPSRCGAAWCWSTTTCVSAPPTCCGSTSTRACGWCSTTSTSGASTRSGSTCATRWPACSHLARRGPPEAPFLLAAHGAASSGAKTGRRARRTHERSAGLDGARRLRPSVRIHQLHAHRRARVRRDAGGQGQGHEPAQAAARPPALCARSWRARFGVGAEDLGAMAAKEAAQTTADPKRERDVDEGMSRPDLKLARSVRESPSCSPPFWASSSSS